MQTYSDIYLFEINPQDIEQYCNFFFPYTRKMGIKRENMIDFSDRWERDPDK